MNVVNTMCQCGKRLNDHIILPGCDGCGDGFCFAPKPSKGSSTACVARRPVEYPRSVHVTSSDVKDLTTLRVQVVQQDNELRQLRAFKAAAEAKAAADAKAADEAKAEAAAEKAATDA